MGMKFKQTLSSNKPLGTYRSLCFAYTRTSIRDFENEKSFKLAMTNAENLAKQIEDLLRSEMNADVDENDQRTQPTPIEHPNNNADGNMVSAKGLKKRETSKGRKRRIKSKVEISMNKNKRQRRSNKNIIEVTPDPRNNADKDNLDQACNAEDVS